jgi:hypothetical protein
MCEYSIQIVLLLLLLLVGMRLRPKKPDCAVCGTHPSVTALIDYEAFVGAPACDLVAADPSTSTSTNTSTSTVVSDSDGCGGGGGVAPPMYAWEKEGGSNGVYPLAPEHRITCEQYAALTGNSATAAMTSHTTKGGEQYAALTAELATTPTFTHPTPTESTAPTVSNPTTTLTTPIAPAAKSDVFAAAAAAAMLRIDIRPPTEFAICSMPGFVNIPLKVLQP